MKIKKPNIHIFVEHKKYYLYDVNINAVVTIPYELYEFFSLWGKEDEKEIISFITFRQYGNDNACRMRK